MNIKLGTWYSLYDSETKKTLTVIPFDGREINQLGVEEGFIHYMTIMGEKGFCGTSYFEDNSKLGIDNNL